MSTAAARTGRPLRADASRNRRALIDAARTVFERDGFVDARVTDIAEEAGLAHGSFYSHFDSKEDALATVLAEVEEEMLHPRSAHLSSDEDPVAAIEAANRAYLEAYRRNAKLMAVLEQVATVDERFRRLRRRRTAAFVKRNADGIRRLQERGLADPALDPELASLAISAMVSRTAYANFVGNSRPVGIDALTATLTRLWANALRIPGGE
ncbi:MAG TPA: TetR/AcrR family transcriptional regulator [Thermoleophilaceae bacterium]|nr:TetR/AcrR family transcriptional regulator [Thermoleophilaceae bacterium]